MNRYVFAICIYACLFIICSCKNPVRPGKTKPNILVFLADDMGYGDLACYGNPIVKTPNIDRLAAEGIRFTDCHSGGTVCSPSRAALLTGRHPYRLGLYYIAGKWGAHLVEGEITLAELLKDAGYNTAFFGKWHLSKLENPDQPNPGDQGFNYWLATTHSAHDGPENPGKFIRNGTPTGTLKGWYCDIIVEEARQWLRASGKTDKPFFMLVCSHEPHAPIHPPDSLTEIYRNALTDSLEKQISYGNIPRPEHDISSRKYEYYATVSQLDAAFGDLMHELEDLGEYENTLVFFTSDNGPENPVNYLESKGEWYQPGREKCFGTPGIYRGVKRYTYEGGHRVPGIIRWPGIISEGTESNQLFNGCDLLPTICFITGTELPVEVKIDGVNAYNALINKPVYRSEPVLWAFPTFEDLHDYIPHLSMRSGNYTLIGFFPDKTPDQDLLAWMKSSEPAIFELYDLRNDPSQEINIIDDDPTLSDKLIDQMSELWVGIRDEGPTWQ